MSRMRARSRHDAGAPAGRRTGAAPRGHPGWRPALAFLGWFVLGAGLGCETGPLDRLHARLELKAGNESYLRGEYRQAMSHYERAVVHRPGLARAHLNWAYGAMALCRGSDRGDMRRALADSAVAALQRYLGVVERSGGATGGGPSVDRVEGHIITLYLDSEQPEKAREFLEARLQRQPTDLSSMQMLAQLAVDRGDLEAALHWTRERIALLPDSAMAYYALGVVAWQFSYYNRVPPEKRGALLDEGLAAVLRAVELDAESSEALTYANLLVREKAKYAASAAEKSVFEAQYREYEARAQRLRERQNGAFLPPAAGVDSAAASFRNEVNAWPAPAPTP